jgi:hypothetical protein
MKYDEKLLLSSHFHEVDLEDDLKAGDLFVCEEIDYYKTIFMKVDDDTHKDDDYYDPFDAVDISTGKLYSLGAMTVVPLKKFKLVSK